MKKVCVIGAGGTGCTMAADMALKGHEVTLYSAPSWGGALEEVRAAGGIRMTGQAATGFAVLSRLEEELEPAVRGADVILVALTAVRHKELAAELAPLLRSGQTVCFSAGNCGSVVLRRAGNISQGVLIGEMQGNIYPCRFSGPAEVKCAFPYMEKKVSAFPAKDTPLFIEAMREIYACVPAKNVMEACFNSPNLSIHLAGSLLNTGGIEHDPSFRLYAQGLTPSILTCIRAVESEKALVMERMGFEHVAHAGMIEKLMQYGKFPELDDFRQVSGPSSMHHRYITEDASVGQSLFISLAHSLGFSLPCMESLVVLAGILNGRNYLQDGMTLASLGLDALSAEEINNRLHNGFQCA